MTLPAGTPLVVIGDDWGRHVSTLQHLFRRLTNRHPIVWVNSYGHRVPRLTAYDMRRALQKLRAMATSVGRRELPEGDGPALIIDPRALPWHNVPPIHRLNTWSIRRDVLRALRTLGSDIPPVLVTGTPIAEGLIGAIGEQASIYYCIDDYAELPYVSASLVAPKELKLLQRVDAVIATARALVHKKRPASGLAFQIPQGVNYEHFANRQPVPAELVNLPRPIIGFAGGVSECCDLALIGAVADEFPHASVVLVGPVTVDTNGLRRENLHLLGSRPYAALPAYVQAFDVGMIPYILNEWTNAVDPLKLLEYLAAGVPVVSTPVPEVLKYASAVSVGPDRATFVDHVAKAVANRAEEQEATRKLIAQENTWDARALEFLRVASLVVESRSRR